MRQVAPPMPSIGREHAGHAVDGGVLPVEPLGTAFLAPGPAALGAVVLAVVMENDALASAGGIFDHRTAMEQVGTPDEDVALLGREGYRMALLPGQ